MIKIITKRISELNEFVNKMMMFYDIIHSCKSLDIQKNDQTDNDF